MHFGEGPNYVFFVSFGQSQAHHAFDEGVSGDGILRWQSQPSQGLGDRVIRDLINHDETASNVLLFLRASLHGDYHFMGKLRYLVHDESRERPVYFQWKIMEFHPTPEELSAMALTLEHESAEGEIIQPSTEAVQRLLQASVPPVGQGQLGVPVDRRVFQGQRIDYEGVERRNRNLGLAGEKLVLEHEKASLIRIGAQHLAERVRHVAAEYADTKGYDILSFDPEGGREKHIEVKTTLGPSRTPFYMTANEIRYMGECPEKFQIFRLYEYRPSVPDVPFFVVEPPLENAGIEASPTQFRMKFR